MALATAAADALVFSRPPVRNGLTVVAKFQGRASPRSRLDDSCDGKEPLKEPFPPPSGAHTNALRSNCSCLQAFLRRKGEKKNETSSPDPEGVRRKQRRRLLASVPLPLFFEKKNLGDRKPPPPPPPPPHGSDRPSSAGLPFSPYPFLSCDIKGTKVGKMKR